MAFLKVACLNGTRESSTTANRLLFPILQTNGKPGGALSRFGLDDPGQPTGYILAITRRCLNWLNEALSALQEIHPTLQDEAIRNQSRSLTSNIHSLRSAISDLRQELTNGLPPGNSSNSG